MNRGKYIRTEDIRARISAKLRGRKLSERAKFLMSRSRKGKPRTQELKDKVRAKLLGHSVSDSTRKKISEALIGKPGYWLGRKRPAMSKLFKGNRSHFWKGGRSSKTIKIRMSAKYSHWRKRVFERDNYTCIWCGARSGGGKTVVLNADHIKSFSKYPKNRFTLKNGRTLCLDCHKKTETFGGKSHKNV